MAQHHDDDGDGVADRDDPCLGENRADPDSWADPDIVTHPWEPAPVVEPAELTDEEATPCS